MSTIRIRIHTEKLFLEGRRLSAGSGQKVWSHDLAMPGDPPEPWMLELANMLILKGLPTA